MDFNTLIFDGDVEWSYYDEQQMWAAFITPDNALSQAGQIIVTFEGDEYEAVYLSPSTYGLYKNGEVIAQLIMLSENLDSFVLASLSEPTDPHVKIVQDEPVGYPFYSGTLEVTSHENENYATFEPNLAGVSIDEINALFGTINGDYVESNIASLNFGNGYEISVVQNVWRFFASEPGNYAVDLQYELKTPSPPGPSPDAS